MYGTGGGGLGDAKVSRQRTPRAPKEGDPPKGRAVEEVNKLKAGWWQYVLEWAGGLPQREVQHSARAPVLA